VCLGTATYRGLVNAEEDSGGLNDVIGTGVTPWDLMGLHTNGERKILRKALTMYRLSEHSLPIEKGCCRQAWISREDRPGSQEKTD
jgi:hypothetical protein